MKILRQFSRLFVFSCVTLLIVGTARAQAPFEIGQPAPEFRAGRWLKHGPISRLEPGQIYVLEFWATWCGSCHAAMPHLTETARKHGGKVTVIGVNFMERGTPQEVDRQVDEFVKRMGNDLDYPNCRDTADDYLLNHWFKPTRSPGIPTTIVVDAAGRIAWTGHPKNLDRVLDELLAGTFDYEKSARDFRISSVSNDAMVKLLNEYGEAMQAKDWGKAIAVVDDTGKDAARLWLLRFNALVHLDPAQAVAAVKEAIAKTDPRSGEYLRSIARADGLSQEVYQFAASELAKDDQPMSDGTRAKLAHRLGDPAKAVEYQLKFKEHVQNQPQEPLPSILEQIESDLKIYRGN